MEMHDKLESFYKDILDYAGLKLDKGVITHVNEKLDGFSIDDKPLTLPYFSSLKNPSGRHIFHPLNENYANAENAQFNLYRAKLAFEINLRLSNLFLAIIRVSSDVMLQQRAKSSKLIELLSSVQETDMTTAEAFVRVVKAAQTKAKESFMVDFYLKKNGEVDGTPYSAIGKVNFHLYRELVKALEDKDEYRVYGCKIRKKDVLSFINIFQAVFPDIDNTERYVIGTDHKPFRMFNALLLTTHQIAFIINNTVGLLNEIEEPSLALEDSVSNLKWGEIIEDVYNLTPEIRSIPNQTNIEVQSHQLKVKEPKLIEQPATQPQQALPVYLPPWETQPQQPTQPQQVAQPQQVYQPPQQQQPQVLQQPQALSPEDIIRGGIARQQSAPMMNGFPQQGFMQQPQFANNFAPSPYSQPQFNQPQVMGMSMMQPQFVQQGMMPMQSMQPQFVQPGMMPMETMANPFAPQFR